jgi:hypothetical protein
MTSTELHDMQVVAALESTVRESEWRRGKLAFTDLPRCKTVCQSATAQLEHIHFEPILRVMDKSVQLSTGENFSVEHFGRLWAIVSSARQTGVAHREAFDLGILRVTQVNSDGDIYAVNTTAYVGSNYRLLIRFFEVEGVASDLENAI